MADMASRIASLRAMVPELDSALHSFTASFSKFRIVRTVNPTNVHPKTLYILDSSFNPPSIAHLALANSALSKPALSDARPHRLLLLFSTHNADKAPSAASFVQRLALMTMFAEDIYHGLETSVSLSDISIDVGLTKEPYYTDKSIAIVETQPPAYPSNPTHVHLVGYDTLIRFCAAKYYPNHDPPLSALAPFFDAGHKLRVTQRPYDAADKSSSEFGTAEQQQAYLQKLRDGESEKDGFKREWGQRLDMVAGGEGVGVSSTRVRNAAKEQDWDTVAKLCTDGVAAWVKEAALYEEDARGAKMA